MAYTLGNKCAKSCCKQTVLVQLIVEDVITFLEHSVYSMLAVLVTHLWDDETMSPLAILSVRQSDTLVDCVKIIKLLKPDSKHRKLDYTQSCWRIDNLTLRADCTYVTPTYIFY